MLTNGNLFTALPNAQDGWRFHPTSVNLVAMPLFHIGGGGWALASMYQGGTIVLHREVDPAAIVRDIPAHEHHPRLHRAGRHPVHAAGAGGVGRRLLQPRAHALRRVADLRAGARRRDGHLRRGFMQAYGLTETTGQVVSMAPDDHDPGGERAHLLRAAGKADPGVELRIVDPATVEDVPVGEVGEIWCARRRT